jgi:hypothetical protein
MRLAAFNRVLFFAAGLYALVRKDVVEDWARLSSKRLANELKQVGSGTFDFEKHAHLIASDQDDDDD